MNLHFPYGFAALLLLTFESCTHTGLHRSLSEAPSAPAEPAKMLAVYEPWFGHPQHISVGYSSQDPVTIKKQIQQAKSLGISGFVVDWYGDREPYIDKSYALVQSIAADEHFNVAMMYDESTQDADMATDDALVAFDSFREKYLAPEARGRQAYLNYKDRPMIFIFPKGGRTDWNRVREETNKWSPAPLLIYEYRPTTFATAFDGFYAWINPGPKGWIQDGSAWGEEYLRDFYKTMQTKYQDKIAVGAVWPGFDDRKASWTLNRYMSRRCGETLADTMNVYRQTIQSGDPVPFLLIATWNDYEEGSAIERESEKCTPVSKALRQ
jgi:hypothetical protein